VRPFDESPFRASFGSLSLSGFPIFLPTLRNFLTVQYSPPLGSGPVSVKAELYLYSVRESRFFFPRLVWV